MTHPEDNRCPPFKMRVIGTYKDSTGVWGPEVPQQWRWAPKLEEWVCQHSLVQNEEERQADSFEPMETGGYWVKPFDKTREEEEEFCLEILPQLWKFSEGRPYLNGLRKVDSPTLGAIGKISVGKSEVSKFLIFLLILKWRQLQTWEKSELMWMKLTWAGRTEILFSQGLSHYREGAT